MAENELGYDNARKGLIQQVTDLAPRCAAVSLSISWTVKR
jgi:hypothetical protein